MRTSVMYKGEASFAFGCRKGEGKGEISEI